MLMEVSMAFDSDGQLLSLDLLLYLVALSIVMFLSLYIYLSFDASGSDMIITGLNDKHMDNLEDALFKTPGMPDNWHLLDDAHVSMVGLCVDNDSYLVSYDKLLKLRDNPGLIYTVFPSEYRCNVMLEPCDNPTNRINIIRSYSYGGNENVLTRRIPIIIDYGYNISSFDSDNDNYNCPYNHLNDDGNWRCKSFNISRSSLVANRYYILSDNANVILSNTYGQNMSLNIKDSTDITDKLNTLITDDEDTIYIHVRSDNHDSYMVCDKNNRPEHLDSVISPEEYTAIIEIST